MRLLKQENLNEKVVFFALDKVDHTKLVNARNEMRKEYRQATFSMVVKDGIQKLKDKLNNEGIVLDNIDFVPTRRGKRNSQKVRVVNTSLIMHENDVDWMYQYIAYKMKEEHGYIKRYFIRDLLSLIEN